ncbi:MAG: hypothetical protein JXM74_02975, partial [Fusobacteriaceae bacterium]|nr:hypothetical protein [Fusobacteriaceae bacterium]
KEIFLNLSRNQLNLSSKLFENKGFKNIFLMDSSEIKLPVNHKDKYKGSNKSNPSVLKVNLLIELLGYSLENLVVSEGRMNEHNFSKYVYDKLSVDSLVMKDLGYYKYDDLKQRCALHLKSKSRG